MSSYYTHLKCHLCDKTYDKNSVQSYCLDDHQPLEAVYNLDKSWTRDFLIGRPANMWRYHEVLPLEDQKNRISMDEGFTPLGRLSKLEFQNNQSRLYLKDESGNPTGSFKARGLSMAVSKAKELEIKALCIPTAGNAGSALSAYGAKAGMEIHVFMPEATPKVFQLDCEIMGARVTKVIGNISDAAATMRSKNDGSWFDVTTLKEPFRLEGKKTLGYEIAEQLNWVLPNVIIYPTGGGTGLIGIWKAFKEMKMLGWIDQVPSRMVAVQSVSCDPVVEAFNKKMEHTVPYDNPEKTIANGLRVPKAFGDRLILKTLYESNGTAISITDNDIRYGLSEFAKSEGFFLSPEGAAVWMAYKKLKQTKWIKQNESVVLLNTGSAYKYAENLYSD